MSSLGSGSGSRSEEPQIDPSEGLDIQMEEVELGDLENGDQIAVRGNIEDLSSWLLPFTVHTRGSYLHHGIFVKENLSVIELHGESKEDARPKIRPFLKFFSGHDKLYRVRYKEGECFSVEETMRRANEAVEKGNAWPPYSVISNNCESFATLLKTGKAVSRQVLMALVSSLKRFIGLSETHATQSIGTGGSLGSITSRCFEDETAEIEP